MQASSYFGLSSTSPPASPQAIPLPPASPLGSFPDLQISSRSCCREWQLHTFTQALVVLQVKCLGLSPLMHFHTAGWADLLAQFLQAEAFRAGELEEELVKSIGRQGAEVVMNMLNPYPDERLTATQALQTPYLSKGSAQVMQPSQTELTPTAHAVHGQVGQQPPEGLEHIEAQAHAAAADQQQLSLPVVHDRLNGAALSEHAQTELYNGKGDASQGTAVIKACTKTDQPSWNERSKDSGQGLQNGGHKVSLAAHAG